MRAYSLAFAIAAAWTALSSTGVLEGFERLTAEARFAMRPAPGYRPQQLAPSLRLQLQRDEHAPVATAGGPQLLVLSSDEVSPFTLHLELRGKPQLTLASDGLEEVRIEAP